MNEISQIVTAVVSSVGGVGAAIAVIVYLMSNFIAEKLEKKYELKLNGELEKIKAGIENKKYISKTKFDTEFEIKDKFKVLNNEIREYLNTLDVLE